MTEKIECSDEICISISEYDNNEDFFITIFEGVKNRNFITKEVVKKRNFITKSLCLEIDPHILNQLETEIECTQILHKKE